LKFDKKFNKDCDKSKKNDLKKDDTKKDDTKPHNDNPINDDPDVDPNDPSIDKPEKNPLPKDTTRPLPYKDEGIEDLWKRINPIIETLKNLKSKFLHDLRLNFFNFDFFDKTI
jgi:hypothetical protein